ncbi:hypothetical protein [Kaistia terrae]|uniref:Uncharacterized protein n=1 Tax=Kaistia terrae TaxID=537017 RepID=A0ABW0Q3L7_9HYPH|nr:hypothetical protein [Kaistia terrae]MCX5581351.1 hypothetical protein [Kaistia terrae]
MIKLGDKVCDPVTGFTGTATARLEELGTAPQIRVEAQNASPHEAIQSHWLNEPRLLAKAD